MGNCSRMTNWYNKPGKSKVKCENFITNNIIIIMDTGLLSAFQIKLFEKVYYRGKQRLLDLERGR